jgi:hypothetical protein
MYFGVLAEKMDIKLAKEIGWIFIPELQTLFHSQWNLKIG